MNHTTITPREFAQYLASGPFAWPGGYPIYFITADGAALSFEAAKANARPIFQAIRNPGGFTAYGWRVIAADVNWEDPALYCDHTGARIPSAYAEDSAA